MDAQAVLQELIDAERVYKATVDRVQAQGAAVFKSVRAEYNLSQRALADALGVDHTFISKVENGHTRPGKPVLTRLAAWLEERPAALEAEQHPGRPPARRNESTEEQ